MQEHSISRCIICFAKKEAVLLIAACLAAISAFFIPPSAAYIEYIDFHVLILLFCLMAVVAGVQKCGFFEILAERLCEGELSLKKVLAALVLLPFFTSMLITNDVALITFVPFAALVLSSAGQSRYLIITIVLQTIAANLGSMATPVGNPQNLFLYSRFFASPAAFFRITMPFVLLALLMLLAIILCLKNKQVCVSFPEKRKLQSKGKLALWIALFALCLLAVFHVLNDWILLGITVFAMLAFERELFRRVDYGLLLTFVCFFVFAGNIAQMEPVRLLLERLMAENAGLCTLLASQVISNVPAAVMLSNFTQSGTALLIYSNLGGLGTLIASLASLISFKIYLRIPGARPLRYLLIFTLWNLVFLAVLGIFSIL